MERDRNYYQEKIELTPAQKKAWAQLVRAVNKCKKENILFYQHLEKLSGLNGNNAEEVGDSLALSGNQYSEENTARCLQWLDFPSVKTECSFADDHHFVRLKDEWW